MKSLKEAGDKQIDLIKRKSVEATWIPTNLRTKAGLARCLQEHAEYGLILDSYVTGDCWIQLSNNTMSFIKQFLLLLNDCLKLETPELLYTVDETLYNVFEVQITFIELTVRNEQQSDVSINYKPTVIRISIAIIFVFIYIYLFIIYFFSKSSSFSKMQVFC